jgi:hypothetical protein
MRAMLTRPAVQISLVAALLVIVMGAGYGLYTQATAFSYQDLLTALAARGASVQEHGAASTLTFQGRGHALTVNGATVDAYEYSAPAVAQLDAARVSSDGATFRGGAWPFGGSAVTVDWIAPPHDYRRGRVIVMYIGEDGAITRLLSAVLGPQFAGGATPSLSNFPSGDGYLRLIQRLRAYGATVATLQHMAGTTVFSRTQPTVDGYELRVNGSIINAFAFTDNQAAATTYAAHITGGNYSDPASHTDLLVDYAAPPHFYRMGKVIALYVGSDRAILRLLASALGPPFAEEHF